MNAAALHHKTLTKVPDVAVTSIARRPRAIVVVLGWKGAKMDELSNYSELYHQQECSTISATAPLLASSLNDGATLGEWAVAISREAARLVRMAQMSEMGAGRVPILIHILGNGGLRLVAELERRLRQFVVANQIPALQQARSLVSPIRKFSSTSTRSLFTNATEPLSDDDDDDDESKDASEQSTIVDAPIQSSPSKAAVCRIRPTISTLEQSQSSLPRRPRKSPSVNRVDMARNGLNLNHSCNPDDRACQRDLELFASHLSMILWDIGPRREMGWILGIVTQLVLACAYIWRIMKGWLFVASTVSKDATNEQLGGLSLTRKHAFVYNIDQPFQSEQLMTKANAMDADIMRCKLSGDGRSFKRKRYSLNEYVTFVTRVVDCISENQSGEGEDGWSSVDEEPRELEANKQCFSLSNATKCRHANE